MPYDDIWKNNLRYRLLEEASTPVKPENKFSPQRPPMFIRTPNGDSVYNKVRMNTNVLPAHVTHLDISDINFDQRYIVHVPNGVKWLDISDVNYEARFFSLPDTLETIIFKTDDFGNPSPWDYPKPKPGLKVLDLTGHTLYGLENLPDSLEVLILKRCENLRNLPDKLPKNLRVIDVSECPNLKALPTDVPEGLKEFWANGCEKVEDWLWKNGFKWGVGNYWEIPKFLRQLHEGREEIAQERAQKRCHALRQELIASAYNPERVELWLNQGGYDLLEMMMG